jgi:hypothetical protein
MATQYVDDRAERGWIIVYPSAMMPGVVIRRLKQLLLSLFSSSAGDDALGTAPAAVNSDRTRKTAQPPSRFSDEIVALIAGFADARTLAAMGSTCRVRLRESHFNVSRPNSCRSLQAWRRLTLSNGLWSRLLKADFGIAPSAMVINEAPEVPSVQQQRQHLQCTGAFAAWAVGAEVVMTQRRDGVRCDLFVWTVL